MDRTRLRQLIPAGIDFAALEERKQKRFLVGFIGGILDELGADGAEPDDWEARNLGAALGYGLCGCHAAAMGFAGRAITPPSARSPGAWLAKESTPNLAQLARGLEALRAG